MPKDPRVDVIREQILALLRSITPPGTRIQIGEHSFLEVDVVCDGATPNMGYYCLLPPGHQGKCWCRKLQGTFAPEVGGPGTVTIPQPVEPCQIQVGQVYLKASKPGGRLVRYRVESVKWNQVEGHWWIDLRSVVKVGRGTEAGGTVDEILADYLPEDQP